MFAKAVEIDPQYARAYAGMANCDARLWGWYNVPTNAEELLAIADKALALDPNLAEAHAARGEALVNSNRRAEAAAAFERALELDPNSFDANLSYARFCVTEGKLEKAVELYTRALEIQPDDSQAPLLLQIVYRSLGRRGIREIWPARPEAGRGAAAASPGKFAAGTTWRVPRWRRLAKRSGR